MKYNRKKLIDRANAKIKELDKTVKESKTKAKQEWDDYKQRLLVATELYLKNLKEWDAKPGSAVPSATQVYMPSGWRGSSNDEMRQAELRRFVAQLDLSDEETIVFKTQYDMQLLNCIVGI